MTTTTLTAGIEWLRTEMASRPAGLVRHVERVVKEARDLAPCWGVDPDRAALAAWGHDLFRAHSPEEQLRLAAECGVPIGDIERATPVFLHGPIAAVVLRERFSIGDDEVLTAVAAHTTGLPSLPMLAKVILLADKFEPRKRRRDVVLPRIRTLARRDIDAALLCWSDWNWVQARTREWAVHPDHWRARLAWVGAHHEELYAPGLVRSGD